MKQENKATLDAGRIELAIRMLRMQARTQTIVAATRLSEDQVRRLYRQFCRGQTAARQRGRSPESLGSFLRTLADRFSSSLLAGVLLKHGLLDGRGSQFWSEEPIAYADRFCRAYAEYLAVAGDEPMGFERAWFFARNLDSMNALSLRHCATCDSHFVHDDSDVRRQTCPMCKLREQARVAELKRKLGL